VHLPLARAIALLQRYPVAFLLPTVLIVAAAVGINYAFAGLAVSQFLHFLLLITGLLINFFLTCVAFLCVAAYTVRCELNGEQSKLGDALDVLKYPGCGTLLGGLLTRFAITLVASGALTLIVVAPVLQVLKTATHHPVPRSVSGQAYLWVALIFGVVILSRWALAIPLFAQSKGLLKSPFSTSVKAIKGLRGFVVVFTLFVWALRYTLTRLTTPLHPHLSDGATRYVPHLLEIIAAHGFQAVLWAWWMIVLTLLCMRLQTGNEPLPVTPLAAA
jgi:hypothetical protein